MKKLVLFFIFLSTFSYSAYASDYSSFQKLLAHDVPSLKKGEEITLKLGDALHLTIKNDVDCDNGSYSIVENSKEKISGKITSLHNIVVEKKKVLLAYRKGKVYYEEH